jgi:hypothetical protein
MLQLFLGPARCHRQARVCCFFGAAPPVRTRIARFDDVNLTSNRPVSKQSGEGGAVLLRPPQDPCKYTRLPMVPKFIA